MQFTDQLQRTINIDHPPKRIISIVPSQTELLFDLGLNDEVVGITKFCIHPDEWFRNKTRVGGTKQLKTEVIEKLNPDLIIANKEENQKEQLELLMQRWPVWVSDIKNLEGALSMINSIGEITRKSPAAENIIADIRNNFQSLSVSIALKKSKRAVYLIWYDPIMCAGSDTFINDLMQHCGFENIIAGVRYPEISHDSIETLHPEYILLSSEPFPFNTGHQHDFQKRFPFAKIILADGEYFSWYGSRLLKAPSYFNSLRQALDSES